MLCETLRQYQAYLQFEKGLSFNSISAYVSDLKDFPTPLSLTQNNIEEVLHKLLEKGLSRKSVARKLSSLRVFYQFALQENLISENPASSIEFAQKQKEVPKSISLGEVEKIFELYRLLILEAKDEREKRLLYTYALMTRTLYSSGMRISELITLKESSIDFKDGILRVLGKGSKTRLVPIDRETLSLFVDYKAKIRPLFYKGGSTFFVSSHGRGFSRQGFWKAFRRFAHLAGVPNSTPHTLRHSYATHLLEKGMNLRSLQMLLGHSDLATTQIYTKTSTQHLYETVKKHHPKAR
ncbi:MAG: tyrosine-type recombinase/integrase [Bacteriovoracia bacterium]